MTRPTFALVAVCAAGLSSAAPMNYEPEKDHSQIAFSVDHFGFSRTHGTFQDLKGTLSWDEQHPEKSTLELIIDVKSIATGNADRDKDLLGAELLDAAKFPEIRFVSTAVKKLDPKKFQVAGNITMHGQTHPATFIVALNKAGPNPFSQMPALGFSGMASLKRSDFGVAGYLPGIGDEVVFTVDLEFGAVK